MRGGQPVATTVAGLTRRRPRRPSRSAPGPEDRRRTLGEAHRLATREDGLDQTYLPGEMIPWGSSVFLISRTTCQKVVSFWDSQFIV